jgi:GTP-binding protein
LVAKGGNGGWGNHHFRSATNRTPREFQRGHRTAVRNLYIQLKLIAEVGLIGLPNAGKTSLLNELTSANAKVANYAFTTLEPNLGVTKGGKIIADIPGLIEGASDGKGLGIKFLKHVERTKILVHCLSCESQDPKADYEIVRQEIKNYSSVLVKKPEILILTKSDILEPAQVKKIQKALNAKLSVSIIDAESLKKLSDLITKSLT